MVIAQKSRWGKGQSAVCPPVSQVLEGRLRPIARPPGGGIDPSFVRVGDDTTGGLRCTHQLDRLAVARKWKTWTHLQILPVPVRPADAVRASGPSLPVLDSAGSMRMASDRSCDQSPEIKLLFSLSLRLASSLESWPGCTRSFGTAPSAHTC